MTVTIEQVLKIMQITENRWQAKYPGCHPGRPASDYAQELNTSVQKVVSLLKDAKEQNLVKNTISKKVWPKEACSTNGDQYLNTYKTAVSVWCLTKIGQEKAKTMAIPVPPLPMHWSLNIMTGVIPLKANMTLQETKANMERTLRLQRDLNRFGRLCNENYTKLEAFYLNHKVKPSWLHDADKLQERINKNFNKYIIETDQLSITKEEREKLFKPLLKSIEGGPNKILVQNVALMERMAYSLNCYYSRKHHSHSSKIEKQFASFIKS